MIRRLTAGALLLVALTGAAAAQTVSPPVVSATGSGQPTPSADLGEIDVTAARFGLLGTAMTASEGVVDDQEIQLSPTYRPGQVLETVPGLIVTLHSGEGKANQYLMRGYNLDHGTDLETYVDGMPINQPTHAHGQGYTDLNFMIPELADQITYTKGPYYANVGDFGAVGSVHVCYRDTIPDQLTTSVGTLGFERVLGTATQSLGDGHLLQAAEFQHYDGPFVVPDNALKENGVIRYSVEGQDQSYSLTAMIYHQDWTNTTDIPFRAVPQIGWFGSLDPTDGGHALRASFSANYHAPLDDGQITASAFYIYNQLHLFNDFTHYLVDPVNGDQEDQFETRNVLGNSVEYTRPVMFIGIPNEVMVGALSRYDWLNVGRLPSAGQVPLMMAQSAGDPASFSNNDNVSLFAGAIYGQVTTHWTPWLRSVVGVRDDYQHGIDDDLLGGLHATAGYSNQGARGQSLAQPKGSLIFNPLDNLEFYVSGGEGFHSADLRGVNQDKSIDLGLPNTPLLAKQYGEEAGVRASLAKKATMTLAFYTLYQQSETIVDPDVGQDSAGPPSRRAGFEINATYEIADWLEFYGSFSGNSTRFTHPFDDGTGHLGTHITDAPYTTGNLALYLKNLGAWSGGLNYRYLGNYPLSSGPCNNTAAVHDFPGVATSCADAPTALGQVNGKGFGQLNLDVHYDFGQGWMAGCGIYNLLDTHAAAAEFWYVDRLQSEINTYPDGRADIHQHPLEPLMARLSLTKQF